MQRRPEESAHGGLWEFPGGKLEHGEPPELATARELAEELGVIVAPEDLVPISFASGETGDPLARASLVILLYACRRWQGEPMPHAASELGWYERGRLAELSMPPLDYPLATALSVFLSV